jgi:outer membrane protein insertion porin family
LPVKKIALACGLSIFFLLQQATPEPLPEEENSEQQEHFIPSYNQFEGMKIEKILFSGLQKIRREKISPLLNSREGEPLSHRKVSRDIKNIYMTDRFDRIEALIDAGKESITLKFLFSEAPLIKELIITGVSDEFKEKVFGFFNHIEGKSYRKYRINNCIENVRKFYAELGLYKTSISFETASANDHEYEKVVQVVINEGVYKKVRSVTFSGLSTFEEFAFRKTLSMKENRNYNNSIFEEDLNTIKCYFQDRGYLNTVVTVPNKKSFDSENGPYEIDIHLYIEKGDKYLFAGYTFEIKHELEKPLFTEDQLANLVSLKPGDVFNITNYNSDREAIVYSYGCSGHIFARVDGKKEFSARPSSTGVNTFFVAIHFLIEEREPGYIDTVIIKGNLKHTVEELNKYIFFRSGEKFNVENFTKTRELLLKLGTYTEVNFDVRPGSPNGYLNVVIECN